MAEPKPQSSEISQTASRSKFVTILMLIAAMVAIAGFGVLFTMWWSSRVGDSHEVLRIASNEYVEGRPIVAGKLAETVSFPSDAAAHDPELATLPAPSETAPEETEVDGEQPKQEAPDAPWIRLRDFLVGAGKIARTKEVEDARERRRLIQEAIPLLESSAQSGFPPGREAEGHRLLGQALFDTSRYADAAVELQTAIERDPTLQRELVPQLARAQLQSTNNTQDDALRTIEAYLSQGTISRQQQRESERTRIEALIALKRWDDAESAIARSSVSVATETISQANDEQEFRDQIKLLRSILWIQRASERYGSRPMQPDEDRSHVVEELSSTMRDLVDLQREAAPKVAALARLWAALANICEGRDDEALTHLTMVRQQRPFGAEGILGGIEEIELLAEQGRGIEALQTVRYIVRELGDASGFDAAMISLDEFRQRMGDAIAQLRLKGQFKDSIDVARSLPPLFERSVALFHEGLGFRDWAAMTLADGTDLSGEIARSASSVARSRYRAAGDAFAEAAQLEFSSPQYLSLQWSAIDAYQKGRHFRRSIQLLEPYLRYEERRRQPRGLVAYGRALLAEGDADRAIEALASVIIEFPRDPLSYDARLLSAQAFAEQGDVDQAKQLLIDNLQDGELTPQSPAWRDSLMTLGEISYHKAYAKYLQAEHAKPEEQIALMRDNQPNLDEAGKYLDEAFERYNPEPRAIHAAYLAARTRVMSAQWPRLEAESTEILDAARRVLRIDADRSLSKALEGFVYLSKFLTDKEEENRLSKREQAMVRNCLIAEADTLREMNQLEAAADVYRAVSLRYMNEPAALEAILGQSRCMKELGRTREADALVQQAGIVLQRIPAEWDDQFEKITRYDRSGWEKLLIWMNQSVDTAGLQTAQATR